ncbi:thiamine pyrophosphate-dependent dehydrogenase E1 component subunit alpha [Verrucomicrobia bacterium]|nr:thiamine pyrophosphate-dependent dehydrogenase E1 component subunit alpha [Verrucomicrobiota bacterium]
MSLHRGRMKGQIDRKQIERAYRHMLSARILDERLAQLYRAGNIFGGVFLGKGQEALSVAIGMAMQKGDVFAPLIRDGAGRLAFGETILEALRNCLGSPLGPMRSRDGNVHRGRPRDGYIPMISHLGATISVVNGALMAKRMKGENHFVGAACVGEGATSTGAFHEALNQAAIEKLPLLLVVANNQFAYSTPTTAQFACQKLSSKAAGYGVTAHEVDGTNLEDCLQTLSMATKKARQGEGPQLIIAELLRLCGHGEHDDAQYITEEIKKSSVGQDCMQQARETLKTRYDFVEKEITDWHTSTLEEINKSIQQVQSEGGPDPFTHSWKALATRELCESVKNNPI